MNEPSRGLERLVWGGLALAIVGVVVAFLLAPPRPEPGPATPLPILGQVADFTLTNQSGRAVSFSNLLGQVWVADVIFTRCPGSCLTITRRMGVLQAALPREQPVKLVSLTADPAFDTPAVLKQYASRFGANPARWEFLTGPREQIYRLATRQLLLVVVEKPPDERTTPDELFLHSTKFILVDQQGRLRGIYDGEAAASTPAIVRAVTQLLQEKGT